MSRHVSLKLLNHSAKPPEIAGDQPIFTLKFRTTRTGDDALIELSMKLDSQGVYHFQNAVITRTEPATEFLPAETSVINVESGFPGDADGENAHQNPPIVSREDEALIANACRHVYVHVSRFHDEEVGLPKHSCFGFVRLSTASPPTSTSDTDIKMLELPNELMSMIWHQAILEHCKEYARQLRNMSNYSRTPSSVWVRPFRQHLINKTWADQVPLLFWSSEILENFEPCQRLAVYKYMFSASGSELQIYMKLSDKKKMAVLDGPASWESFELGGKARCLCGNTGPHPLVGLPKDVQDCADGHSVYFRWS